MIEIQNEQVERGFTILELLVVIAIIIVLAGLILATTGYVQNKGARSRAEAEIAAMSAASESYKADNGVYPRDANTDQLDPTSSPGTNNANYISAGQSLYKALSGDQDGQQSTTSDDTKNYVGSLIRPSSLATPSGQIPYFKDPFGNPYGYSTSKQNGGNGYNPTFDLWSTANSSDQNQWVKNW